jgi:hypothetical protein
MSIDLLTMTRQFLKDRTLENKKELDAYLEEMNSLARFLPDGGYEDQTHRHANIARLYEVFKLFDPLIEEKETLYDELKEVEKTLEIGSEIVQVIAVENPPSVEIGEEVDKD